MAAAIVDRQGIVWSGAAGLADEESGRAATDSTVYLLSSISKLFVGVIILAGRASARSVTPGGAIYERLHREAVALAR